MNTYATLFVLSLFLAAAPVLTTAERLTVPTVFPVPANRVVSTQSIRPDTGALPGVPRDAALKFVKKQFNLKDNDFVVKDAYASSNGITHVYLKQLYKGIEVSNADMNINVAKDGTILSYGSTFLPINAQSAGLTKEWEGSVRKATPVQAFQTFANFIKKDASQVKEAAAPVELVGGKKAYQLTNIPFVKNGVTVDQTYVQTADGALVAAWRMDVPLDTEDNWFHAHVAADGSKVLRIVDWVSDATYNVVKIGDIDPVTNGRTLVTDPQSPKGSPKGWHDQNGQKFTTTLGNNVDAQYIATGSGLQRADGGAALKFDFPMDLSQDPKTYWQASVTNLFYVSNMMHDIFYHYGFDEKSGNFQFNNGANGGLGNDLVVVSALDASGTNNANFATPPDGRQGKMRMYRFTTTTPNRDGGFSIDVPIHEYAHGISTRLTGGPSNSDCLWSGESGGMGEGWGDFFAVLLQQKASHTSSQNWKMGAYVFNGKTIRKYEYSTSMTTNPTTYAYVNQAAWQEVHAIGEIWANILYQMYWNLRDAMGGKFNADWYSADKTSANTLTLQIIVDGMKLQPCNPTFVDARNAILQAEQAATGGKYKCAIWKAFAKRGVGANAKSLTNGSKVTADTTVPAGC